MVIVGFVYGAFAVTMIWLIVNGILRFRTGLDLFDGRLIITTVAVMAVMAVASGNLVAGEMLRRWKKDNECLLNIESHQITGYTRQGMSFGTIPVRKINSFNFGRYTEQGTSYLYIAANLTFNPIDGHVSGYSSWMDSNVLWHMLNNWQNPILVLERRSIFDEWRFAYICYRLSMEWPKIARCNDIDAFHAKSHNPSNLDQSSVE